jgi:hypothetical protein
LTFNVKINGVPDSTIVALNIENHTYDVRNNNGYYSGWYNRDDQITPTTNSTVIYLIFEYSFSGWQDTSGTVIQTPITVSAPENYTAEYTLSGISFSCFPSCSSQAPRPSNVANKLQNVEPLTTDRSFSAQLKSGGSPVNKRLVVDIENSFVRYAYVAMVTHATLSLSIPSE